jgi:hypothetical protein
MANEAAKFHPRRDSGAFAPATDRRQLTDRQAAFVLAFAANGANAAEAARQAGYSEHSAKQIGTQMLSLPWVQRALEIERGRLLAKAGLKAIGLVVQVLEDETAGLPLRLKAAEIALKADRGERDASKKSEQSKALGEMSVPELEDFIRRGREAATLAAQPIVEGQAEPASSDNDHLPAESTMQPIDPAGEGTAL